MTRVAGQAERATRTEDGKAGEWDRLKDATPETLVSLVPMVLLGTGLGVLSHPAYADTTVHDPVALKAIGIKAADIETMQALPPQAAVEHLVAEAMPNRGNPDPVAIAELNTRHSDAVETVNAAGKPRVSIRRGEDGTMTYAVTAADGKVLGDFNSPETAGIALREHAEGKALKEQIETAPETVLPEPLPADEVATVATEDGPVSIKNADVDAELAKMGLPDATHGEKLTFKAAAEDAAKKMKADPESGARLVADLKENPRPVTGREDALLLNELTRLSNERDAASREVAEARAMGDPVALADAEARAAKARDDYRVAADVDAMVGTENAVGLALRRMRMNRDYTLAAMERRAVAETGGKPLEAKQSEEIAALHQQISYTQKAFDEYRASREQAARAAEPSSPKKGNPENRVIAYFDRQAAEAEKRLQERVSQLNSGIDPSALADLAIIAAKHIAHGVADVGELIAKTYEFARPHIDEILAKARELHDNAPKEATRLESFKKRTTARIDDLTRRAETGDFSKKPKPTPLHLDEEANRLQAAKDLAVLAYENALERYRMENLSTLERTGENMIQAYDASRAIKTTGELSVILRQGMVSAFSHPVITAKALPNMFRALVSNHEAAHALNLQVFNHPDAPAALQAKLHLINEGAKLSRQEELFVGKLVGKIPVIGNIERASTVFLNKLRFEVWNSMRQSSGGLNAAEQKQIAMFVNQSTGRGQLGAFLEPSAVAAGRLMFSPRFLASRIQLAVGHSLWGGTGQTRKLIAKEYAKTLIGLSAYYGTMLGYFGDKDDQPTVGTDPTKADFGKVTVGNTRIDPLAGVAQVIVFASRTGKALGGAIDREIEPENAKQINKELGRNWSDTAVAFARSKAHPVPGTIYNILSGKDLVGNPVSFKSEALSFVTPMTYGDIYHALKEQDIEDGAAMAMLAMLGEGVNTYEAKPARHPQQLPVAP